MMQLLTSSHRSSSHRSSSHRACSVQPGDTVRVDAPVVMPSGRVLQRGSYPVQQVRRDQEGGWEVAVRARLERGKGKPKSDLVGVWLLPGQWTHYASGAPETLTDYSYQTY